MRFPTYFSMALASIFNFFMPVSMAVNPNCDYYQNLRMGQEYYIYNEGYPNKYVGSTACRWIAVSEPQTTIVITCEDIDLPSSTDCSADRLAISLSGDDTFSDSRNYCGTGRVSLVTNGNALAVGLFTPSKTAGGKFVCTLTSIIQDTPASTTQAPNVCDCGYKQETRIVGGQETGVNEFPEMAGIVDFAQRRVFCGSTIISPRYVTSAAHCLSGKAAGDVGVLVGDHDISTGSDTASAALYQVSAFEVHPSFDLATLANDIALIQTRERMTFSMSVGPACLPFRFSSFDFDGEEVTALGWGQLEFSGPTSDTLQKVDLAIVSNRECAAQHSDPVTASQICTYAEGKDSCLSDSGGPLFWTDPNKRRLFLIGIISSGLGCATTRPAVNTRVTSYLSWIVSRTSDTTYCIK